MKMNQWTSALAALAIASIVSHSDAEEKPTPSPVLTALSATTISGYLDTSAQWNFGTGNANVPPHRFGGTDKGDGFNLDVVQLTIEKPLDDLNLAAGYRVDLWLGPDADTLGTQSVLASGTRSDFAIRQAYVHLQMPLFNGIKVKLGVFDSIIGYESLESPANPNYTRSYGHTIEPQTHTGVLASYRFCELVSASAGVANTMNSSINSRAQFGSFGSALFGNNLSSGGNAYAESYKTYMGSLALTASTNMSFLADSTLYAGVVNGFNNSLLGSGLGIPQLNVYVGATIATPLKGLTLGATWDLLELESQFQGQSVDAAIYSVAGYVSFKATEKLSLHGRLEYADATLDEPAGIIDPNHVKILAATATVQYDLWNNVLSRFELRWDHSVSGADLFGGTVPGQPNAENAWMLAANVIYRF